MNIPASSKRATLILALTCIVALSFIFLYKTNTSVNVRENRMATLIFSRSSISNIETYKDEYYIHGLSYFYFRASPRDIELLIHWLELKKHEGIPSNLSDVVLNAGARVGWKFDWNTKKVFLTYYCHADGSNWSIDMLLIDADYAVYITNGYVPLTARKSGDLAACREYLGSE